MVKTYIAGEGSFANIKTAEDLKKKGFISVREINKYLSGVLKEDTFLHDIGGYNRIQRHLDDYGLTSEDFLCPTSKNEDRLMAAWGDILADKWFMKVYINPKLNPQEYDNSKDVKQYVSFLSQHFNRVCLSSNGHNTYYFKKSDIEKYLLNLENPRRKINVVYVVENWGVFDKTISENSLCLSLKSPYFILNIPTDLFDLIVPLFSKDKVVKKEIDGYIRIKVSISDAFDNLDSLFDSLESIFTLCNINCTFYLSFINNRTSHSILDKGLKEKNPKEFETFINNIKTCYPNLQNINDINKFLDTIFFMYGDTYANDIHRNCVRHGFSFDIYPGTEIQCYKYKKNKPEFKSLLKHISYSEYLYTSKSLGTFEIKL